MDIYNFISLVIRKIKLLIFIPVIFASLLFVLTMDQPKEYTSKATIFTALTSSSSLENLGNSRVDFFATKTAYNNLISILNSRNVIEETSLRLLARHLMLDEAVITEISKESFEELKLIIPEDITQLVDKNDAENTYQRLNDYMQKDKSNFLYGLINLNHPHYSFKAISQIKTIQVGGSDIIELNYKSNDQGVAYQTLSVLIEVFLTRYSDLKKNQTNAVVEYFERQLQKSLNELNNAEDRLLKFNKANNIINYYEQTKHISSQQEKIDIKLQDVILEFEAAQAVLLKLEAKTKSRFNINLRNQEILDLRKSLISINRNIDVNGIENLDSLNTPDNAEINQKTKEFLENTIKEKIDSLYIYEKNSDAMEISSLLSDWLKTVIEYESSKARLLAMEVKNKEFQKLYAKYAPLGAILKRIEREIDVKEKAYLEILHHLGLAKLKQQNEEMMAKMKVLDKPHLPIDPQPTKRKVMVAALAVFSMILTLLSLFIYELLDKTVKTTKRYSEKSGLKVSGAFPLMHVAKNEPWDHLISIGTRSTSETIIKHIQALNPEGKFIVQFISHWNGEGKTYLITKITQKLQTMGFLSARIQIEPTEIRTIGLPEQDEATLALQQYDFNTYSDLIDTIDLPANASIVFIELPALSDSINNPKLMQSAHLSFLITDAGRAWASADNFLLDNLKETVPEKLYGILNRVFHHNMEEISGEIPKKRSRIRKLIKRLVK